MSTRRGFLTLLGFGAGAAAAAATVGLPGMVAAAATSPTLSTAPLFAHESSGIDIAYGTLRYGHVSDLVKVQAEINERRSAMLSIVNNNSSMIPRSIKDHWRADDLRVREMLEMPPFTRIERREPKIEEWFDDIENRELDPEVIDGRRE